MATARDLSASVDALSDTLRKLYGAREDVEGVYLSLSSQQVHVVVITNHPHHNPAALDKLLEIEYGLDQTFKELPILVDYVPHTGSDPAPIPQHMRPIFQR